MIDTEELSFEQRLVKVYVKQKHSQSKDLYLLVQSQSDLIELVGDFTKFVDVMIEGFNPKMVSEEKFEIVVKFINSLKDVPIEKHIVLRNKIVDKISKAMKDMDQAKEEQMKLITKYQINKKVLH